MKRLLIAAVLTGMGLISTAALARSSDEARAFVGVFVSDDEGSDDETPPSDDGTPDGPSDDDTMPPSGDGMPPSGGEAPSGPSGGDMPMPNGGGSPGGSGPSGGGAPGGCAPGGGGAPSGGDMPNGGGANGDMSNGKDGKDDAKMDTKANLAVVDIKLDKNGSATVLAGTIKNMGPDKYSKGRTYKLQRFNNGSWTTLQSGKVAALEVDATITKQVKLATTPAAGAKFRMILNKGDDNAQDDVKEVSATATASPDLAAFSLQIVNSGGKKVSKYFLRATIKNNGPGTYTSGRTYTLQKKVGNNWVTLQTGAVSNLTAGNTMTVSKLLGNTKPAAGTQFRLILSPGDAVPSNNTKTIVAS